MKKNSFSAKVLLVIAVFLLFSFILFYKIGQIPAGFFCDEAIQGIRAQELLNFNLENFANIFFYHHFNYLIGNLPVFWLTPFIGLFGLTEASVRSGSAVSGLLTLAIIYHSFKLIGVKDNLIKIASILLIGLSPAFIHLSRIYFGQSLGLLLVSLGWLFFIKAKQNSNIIFPALSGLSFALTIYGYLGFAVFTPLFLAVILLGQIISHQKNLGAYKQILIVLAVFLVLTAPFLITLGQNPKLSQRLIDKNFSKTFFTKYNLNRIIINYYKYFSYQYLLTDGETGSPQTKLSRHSVHGKGLLLYASAPLIAFGFASLIKMKYTQHQFFVPFLFLVVLYPLPDMITTTLDNPPYTFALYPSIILVPYLSLSGLIFIKKLLLRKATKKHLKMILIVMITVIISEGLWFFAKHYQEYPKKSADSNGWQYGAKAVVAYFMNHHQDYDHAYLQHRFNETKTLIDFYAKDNPAQKKIQVGDLKEYDSSKEQLFALSAKDYQSWKSDQTKQSHLSEADLLSVIKYPNDKPAFYLITVEEK